MRPHLHAGPITLRALTLEDLDAAEAVLAAAFPRPADRRSELERGLHLGPEGWFLALAGGEPAGLVGALACGRQAWVGMMAVHPRLQSQGIGRALMTHLLAWLHARGVETVILDASPAGQPLYRSLGFVEEDASGMFERDSAPTPAPPVPEELSIRTARADDLPDLSRFDAERYGADRSAFLARHRAEFHERFLVAREARGDLVGYLCAQDPRIGPWVAISAGVAGALLDRALGLAFEHPVQVITPERNLAAPALLGPRGFRTSWANRHMRLGQGSSPERREEIFGQSGFAFG